MNTYRAFNMGARKIGAFKVMALKARVLTVTAFLVVGLFFTEGVMATEEPKFTLISQDNNFELRRYAPKLIAEVVVQGSAQSASNKGFRLLADFIFGNNTAQTASPNMSEPAQSQSQKISMTAPVVLAPQAAAKDAEAKSTEVKSAQATSATTETTQWRVHFVMPQKYTLATLPKPNNSAVNIQSIPAKNIAALRFSGLTGKKKVAKKTRLLLEWLNSKGYTPQGEPQLARYNPPWVLPFLRRNEVLVEYR